MYISKTGTPVLEGLQGGRLRWADRRSERCRGRERKKREVEDKMKMR
jgi:hypothetical protein